MKIRLNTIIMNIPKSTKIIIWFLRWLSLFIVKYSTNYYRSLHTVEVLTLWKTPAVESCSRSHLHVHLTIYLALSELRQTISAGHPVPQTLLITIHPQTRAVLDQPRGPPGCSPHLLSHNKGTLHLLLPTDLALVLTEIAYSVHHPVTKTGWTPWGDHQVSARGHHGWSRQHYCKQYFMKFEI